MVCTSSTSQTKSPIQKPNHLTTPKAPPKQPTSTTLSPALSHFSSLLSSLAASEQGLTSLRTHIATESALLHSYFTTAEQELKQLSSIANSKRPDVAAERRYAAEKRREKWGELERMKGYEGEVRRLAENVRRREELERKLRALAKEVGGILLEREGLMRECVDVEI
ncbi:hypothetical protein BJ508DRAFT_330526 [Ascobolus immersus RN42]|uniref:Uncharacterized protein n=1 Tax=Ascobolus immersus RN42 TaxID=1160509 RepID=A0A3N4I5G8_ASCIM|nr:hypothetical protein BJ508DRAFT_330526 [Ascobolus immersus RN42]